MRPNQHNKNRNRNRNRNRGHGGGGGGGNGANKVYDSNGPDVKLRGTAQTIAEKYMQLGRDAQSSGDTVMAESYYQFADHYYRVWLAAQPAGQPIQFSRRMNEEEFDDDAPEAAAPAEGEDEAPEGEGAEAAEPAAEAGGEAMGESQPQGEGQNGYPPRQNRFRDNREGGNREGGRDRFQRRWPRRFDRNSQDGQPSEGGEGQERFEPRGEQRFDRQDRAERSERPERQDRAERQDRQDRQERPERFSRDDRPSREAEAPGGGDWEAPSFLKRPAPAAAEGDETPAPRGRPRRMPREDAPPPADEPAAE